ncbi:MAG TPA: DUF167 domain-containing protein [Bacteroidota bacterium]
MKINVRVKPNSRKAEVVLQDDGSYLVCVTVPPVEGKANKQVVELLAEHFNRPKSRISILRGANGRFKSIEVL